ncbi:dephospho-CoA kinase [Myxococcota bacterium]|nr:dephospho-CoA kinase [Myxococcota bacterium]MBU1382490.1 dephospho-CoA kinase [Myxococcota bacterium]MBU1497948.1 dephospho-CoA kinase [Myxococcota bacterium]
MEYSGKYKIIGLTGCIGSGKSTVGRLLESMGFRRVDADELSRSVMNRNLDLINQLVDEFGPSVINNSGSLDRRALAQIVFSSDLALKRLEDIVHPVIEKEALIQLGNGPWPVVFEVPLLFQTKQDRHTDLTVVVKSPVDLRMQRVIVRDSSDEASFNARNSRQNSEDWLLERCDVVILNQGSLDDLTNRVRRFADDLISDSIAGIY